MMRIHSFLFAVLIGSGIAAQAATQTTVQPATTRPENFSHRTDITLNGPGPYHQVTLPLAVYQGVQRTDLGDLRVFNGRGEPVPHALLHSESSIERHVDEKPVPLFPIVSKKDRQGGDGDLSVEVHRNADGTLIAVRQSAAPVANDAAARGVIVDASQLGKGVRSLRLSFGPTDVPFHSYTIETSDDLQQWRMLKADAQLVQLEHDGRRIERNTAEWAQDAGKYLRILWAVPQQAPAILAVTVGVTQTAVERPQAIWSEKMLPAAIDKNTYEYAPPGHMPLEQLRIGLPEPNTLAPIEVQHPVIYRHAQREESRWQTIANTVVFRLQSPQGEVTSPDVMLGLPSESRLRLSVDTRSGGLGKATPSLQIGFVPHVLVFLARGDAPFTLAWGAAGVGNAALPVTTLVPGYSDERKLSASPATLQVVSAPVDAAPPKSDATSPAMRKGALWTILIAGVLVLGAMVWVLLRQMKQNPK
jgi:hypothetical protein